eukprot:TRINITY_DN15395_c0_g1_i1.p2 TRINITY_DN15395_c0_g1~~TRINITY_DN15395_c0_g1_i1.p2  ORF type:complete len:314 (+),score=69.55 TRINITY_DN15395_c0_g1_i1:1632-2573(+)
MMIEEDEGDQGDQLMMRKMAKQRSNLASKRNSVASVMGVPHTPSVTLQGQHQQQGVGIQPPRRPPQNVYEQDAAALRERHLQNHSIDPSKQRQALYNSWPDDKKYLEQQVALLQHELSEKDKQLQRSHTDIKMMECEMEQMRRNHESELMHVKSEITAQLVRTVQTEGIRGLEGLSRMQSLGKFAEGREKERQRVCELERGVVHDLESMQREYENKLSDMKDEYQVRLGWLTHKQAQLEADQQSSKPHRALTSVLKPAAIKRRPSIGAPAARRSSSTHAIKPYGRAPQPMHDGIDHKAMTENLAKEYYARMGY